MALTQLLLKEIVSRLTPGMDVASIGYPDIIAPHSDIADYLGDQMRRLVYRPDTELIQKRHGAAERIPDAASFFGLLGCELDVYDVVEDRGGEIIADFNYPFETVRKYDAVLDIGSAEHCFNIGMAMSNMAGMVNAGGHIFHENPHSGWGNHGFYSLHPTLFHDFYNANGFSIEQCLLVDRNGGTHTPSLTKRFLQEGAADLNVICVANRKSVVALSFPKQSKYL